MKGMLIVIYDIITGILTFTFLWLICIWIGMCMICQQKTTDSLKYPLNANRKRDKSEPYHSFLKSFSGFKVIGNLPVVINFGKEMLVDELVHNQAAWRKY